MKYKTFKNYLHAQLQLNYGQFYSTYEDFVQHMESGEVVIPVNFVIELQEKFEAQKPTLSQEQHKEELAQHYADEIKRIDKEISDQIMGYSTGNATLDMLTATEWYN